MDIAKMVIIRETNLIMWFSPNCYFIFFWHDKAGINIGALDNFQSH